MIIQDWLLKPCSEWSLSTDFRIFSKFVAAVAVDNSIAERGILSIENLIVLT